MKCLGFLLWQALRPPAGYPEPPNKGDAVEGGSCSRRSWKPEPSTPIGMVTNPTPINPQLEMLVCFPCVTMDYL